MRRIVTHILVPIMALSMLLVISCTGKFDWSGISYPCSSSKPCTDGYACQAGVCVASGSKTEVTPDAAGKPEIKHDPDSPFRPPPAQIKAAFLYVGPVGDFGWTWAHEQGRLHLKKLGYETTSAGPVSVKDAPKQIDDFIKNGFNLIVGTSHDFLVPMLSKASQNPDANFFSCSGFETGKNMGSYFGRLYQVEYLAGMIAGSMTKTNRVGVITTIAIPEIIRHVNAFTLGVKVTNPKAEVVVKWVHNWFDVKKEPILTKELLDENTDVIHSHTDTSIPLEMIENKAGEPLTTKNGDKVHTIGYNSINACEFGKRTCVTSVYWNWGPILERLVTELKSGKWDPKKIVWEYLKVDKGSSSFHLSDMSQDVSGTTRLQVAEFFPKLAAVGDTGEQIAFRGPLKDIAGNTRLTAGKNLTDKQLLDMCWFVDGVVDGFDTDGKPKPAVVPSECKGDR